MRLSTPQAILAGALILAAAIVFVFRYDAIASSQSRTAVRLNRLTGAMTICLSDVAPAPLHCSSE